jgi:hypothetical protein
MKGRPTEDVFEDAIDALIRKTLDDDDSDDLPEKLRMVLRALLAVDRVGWLVHYRHDHDADDRGNEP